VLEALDGLGRRSLIERGQRAGSFTLQSVVLEYATARLIAEAASEIEQGRLARLISFGLCQAQAKQYVRGVQEHLLVVPLNATQAAAWLASNQHDFVHASQLFEQSISFQRSLGEPAGETQLLFNAALQARALGHYQQAITLLEEAVTQHRARGDRGSLSAGGLGQALYGLGLMLREQGEFSRAARLFEECVDLHRTLGDREGMAQALLALGDIARDQGNVAQIRTYGEQSLLVFRELGVQGSG
jgi:tetratricopeptide (TPR) repeat protein